MVRSLARFFILVCALVENLKVARALALDRNVRTHDQENNSADQDCGLRERQTGLDYRVKMVSHRWERSQLEECFTPAKHEVVVRN
jgi:hypothetical protein